MVRRRAVGAVVAIVLIVAACSGGSEGKAARVDGQALECAWPMWGQNVERSFAYPCTTKISRTTAARLVQHWFHETDDVVTATPAVADGTIYVGDWSGVFYALSLVDGSRRWTFRAPPHPNVYSGQIVSSAAVADVDGERRVFFASGKTMYAAQATSGRIRWRHELNPEGGADDPTEIQSSPLVVNGMVIFGFDGHDRPGVRAGVVALDARSGKQRWYFDPDAGKPASGCNGIWGSPTVDATRGLVFAGSANCPSSPAGWSDYSEAIFALDLDTGAPEWSFQPRGPSNSDFDFAGAPNLFESKGRAAVGLGGKDGIYYALDRTTGDLLWQVTASAPRVQAKNFSTGGFIGPTAVADGVVVGGTAIDGDCPCLHGIDVETGRLAWQQSAAAPTFAASTIANGVAFTGSTTDFTLRAVDTGSGDVLWSQELAGGIAGGVAIVKDTVVAVAGIREPGVKAAGTKAGVYAFIIGSASTTSTSAIAVATLPPTSAAPPPTAPDPNAPAEPICVASPCTLTFTLKEPPAGTTPTMTIHLQPNPFRIEVRGDDLGPPTGWLRAGGEAEKQGAITYGVFVNDDALQGSLLCVLDGDFDCVSDQLPQDARSAYSRISVLAIANSPELPSPANGFDRLVTTQALKEPVSLG